MKFIVFSDIHASNYKAFASYKDGINSRLGNILSCIEKIQEIGETENVDFYIFGGDLFHTQGYTDSDVFNLTFDIFSRFDRPVICISGNHDNYGSNQLFNISFQKFTNLENIRLLDYQYLEDETSIPKIPLKMVYGVGYHKKYDFDLIKSVSSKILLMHDTPKGLNLNGYIFEEGIDWKSLEKQFDLILFGHIHQPKKISDKTYVIGSPLEHSFADSNTNKRGIWLYENGSMKFVPLKFPKFIKSFELTEDIKKDEFNYYMIYGTNEKLEQDNIIMAEGIKDMEIKSRLGNTSMSNESIVDKYIEVCEVEEPNKIALSFYGKEVLNNAVKEVQSITPSNYILSKISIEGFLSFKDKVELEIKNGVWLVIGKSEVFSSNGAGKTNFFDSICWCLYGRTTKNLLSDDVINDTLNENCKVTLELFDKQDRLVISRFRKYDKQGSGIEIKVNGNKLDGNKLDGNISMLEEKIINLLGYDYDFFLNAIYYSQEKTEFFASSSDATKKNFLDVILQFNKYIVALKEVRNNLIDIESRLINTNNRIDYIKKDLVVLDNKVKEYLLLGQSFEKERNIEIEKWNTEITDLRKSLKELSKSFTVFDNDLLKYKEKYKKIKYSTDDLVDKQNKEIVIFEKELAGIQSEIRLLEISKNKSIQRIKQVENLREDTYCELCGGLITNDNKGACITRERQELKKIEERLIELKEKCNSVERSIVHLNKFYGNEINEYKITLSQYEKIINKMEEDFKYQNSTRISLEYSIKNIDDKINNKIKEANIYSLKVKDIDKEKSDKEKEVDELFSCYNSYVKQKQISEFWEKGFSNKGIKSLLLDDFCSTFNKEILAYMSLVSSGSIVVGLTNQTKLKSGEVSEKLSLKVNILGKDRSYGHLSGGEKRRVDIAVVVTLNKIIRQMYNVSSGLLGMLILDEVFSFLDDTGEENVFYLLKEISNEVKSIFVITHTDELKSYFDNSITVVKKDRNSYLEKD